MSDHILDIHTSMPKINSFDKINKMGKLGLLEALVYACFIIAPRQAEKYKLFDENGKRYNISEVPAKLQPQNEEPDLEATSVSEPNEPTAPAEIIVEEQTPSNSPRIPKSVLAAMAEWLIRKLDESSEPLTRDIIREELKVQFPECELNNSYFGLVMKAVFGRRPALKAKISVASNSIKNEKKPLTEEDTFNIGKLEKAQGFGMNDPLAELILNTVSNAPDKR